MKREYARQLAETSTTKEMQEMFFRARTGVKNWMARASVNKSMTIGYAFNLLSADIEDAPEDKDWSTPGNALAGQNMILEFGEFHPRYVEPPKKKRRPLPERMAHAKPRDFPSPDAANPSKMES